MSVPSRSRMAFLLLAAVLLATMLAPVTAHAGPSAQEAGLGDIQGTVRDAMTGMPITWDSVAQEGVPVFVEVWRDGGGWWEDLSPLYGYPQTIDDGTYYISGLPEGQYYLRFVDFWNTGYRSEFFSNAVDVTAATPVTVTDGGVATANISLEKIEWGGAAGTITGVSDGLPVDEVYVYGYALDGFGDINWEAWGSSSLSLGDWYVEAPAGQYKIWFEDPYGRYLPQYYGGGTDFDAAPWVTVAPTHTTPNLNAAMVKAGHITGTVYAPNGTTPLKGIQAQVFTTDGAGGWTEIAEGAHQKPTDAAGHFDYTGLAAGTYKLVFHDPQGVYMQEAWNDHAAPAMLMNSAAALGDPIVLGAGQTVTGKNATLALGSRITGSVTDAWGAVPWASVWVLDSSSGAVVHEGQTGYDGTYIVGDLSPGTYKISFTHNPDDVHGSSFWYQPNYYPNAASFAAGTVVNIVGSGTTPNINALLAAQTANWGTVSGIVRDATTTDRLSGMLVSLDLNDGGWYEAHTTLTDGTGAFFFKYVVMGQYQVRVNDDPWDSYSSQLYAEWTTGPQVLTVGPPPSHTASMLKPVDDGNGGAVGGIRAFVGNGMTGVMGVPVAFYAYDGSDYYLSVLKPSGPGGMVTVWLPVGEYLIEAGPAVGYVSEFYTSGGGTPDPTLAEPVEAVDGVINSTAYDLVLGADNTISGTVYQADGVTPLEGAHASALRLQPDGMWVPVTWEGVTNATTAANGTYQLRGLRAGQYKVAFSGPYLDPPDPGYGQKWWRSGTSAHSIDQAGIITLAGTGDVEPGINASLSGACTLRGSVVDQDGNRANGIKVKLWWNDPVAGWAVIQSTYAYNSGDIGFYGFSAGEYRLEFLDDTSFLYAPGWYHNVADVASAEEIVMADGQKRVIQQTVNASSTKFMPVSGTTRILTAVKASQAAFEDDSVTTVVIATGYNWPDALGGAALAGAYDGPILLTSPKELAAEVITEIGRLGAEDAIILGGTSAVSTAVETSLKQALGQYHVRRLSGANRYETAVKVAEATVARLGAAYDGTAFVSTGENFPDVLGASPLSAAASWPIYLTDPDALTPLTKSAMQAHHVDTAIILGGKGAVSLAVENSLKSMLGTGGVVRLGGSTRYETAVKVAQYGVDHVYGLGWNNVAIATGQNYPDALSGGVLQGRSGSVLLLTPSDTLDGAVAAKLAAKKGVIVEVRYLGGENAVSTAVRNRVQQILY